MELKLLIDNVKIKINHDSNKKNCLEGKKIKEKKLLI